MRAWYLIGLLCLGSAHAVDVGVQPIYDQETTEQAFAPLLGYLEEQVGLEFNLRYEPRMTEYQKQITAGSYDLVFDQPHFAGWRLLPQNTFHYPVAQLSAMNQYVVFSDKSGINAVKDLAWRPVCAIPSPDIQGFLFVNLFTSPVALPYIVKASRFEEMADKLASKRCVAGVASLSDYMRLKELFPEMRSLYEFDPLTSLAVTISQRIGEQDRELITRLITRPNAGGEAVLRHFMETFAKAEKARFMNLDVEVTRNLGQLLPGAIWGF